MKGGIILNYGFKPTTHGEALIAACMDLGAPLKITRAAVGSGLAGGSLANTHALVHYIADAGITDRRHDGNRLFLSVQYCNNAHPEIGDFVLSEFIVYAQDPETGQETDFLYATLGDSRQPVPAFRNGFPASVWTYPVILTVSGDLQVNVTASPGLVTSLDLQDSIELLKLEIMTNTLTLPLATDAGDPLLTSSGTPLLAVYHPDSRAAILAELAALEGRMSGRIAETADGLAADCAAASMRDRAYADGRVLALERAVDDKLEAQTVETEEQIQTAKSKTEAAKAELTGQIAAAKTEAVSAAETAADTKIAAHNNSEDAHPDFLRLAENTFVPPQDPPPPDPIP